MSISIDQCNTVSTPIAPVLSALPRAVLSSLLDERIGQASAASNNTSFATTHHPRRTSREETTSGQIAAAFQQAADLVHRRSAIYAVADDEARRQLIRAFLAHIRIDADDVDIELNSPWREVARTARYLRETSPNPTGHGGNVVHIGHQTKNPRRISAVRGSKMNLLVELRVELRGLEPLTPTLPGRTAMPLQAPELLGSTHLPGQDWCG